MFQTSSYGGYVPQTNVPWQQLPRYEILRVNGQGGIEALRMAPNSEVLALDTSAPLVWLVQTDGAGYKTPSPFSISPYTPQQPKDPLEERIKVLEERMEAMMSEQSDSVPTGARRRRAEPAPTGE